MSEGLRDFVMELNLKSLGSQSLLKCSTCRMNMRNTVITKCLHSEFRLL